MRLRLPSFLRLSAERELAGMDITEHGGPAYPELVPLDAADPRRDLIREAPALLPAAPRGA